MPALSITDKCTQTGTFPMRGDGTRIMRPLEVLMDGPGYRPNQVKDAVHAAGILYGSPYPDPNVSAWARNFEVTQRGDDHRALFDVQVQYTSEVADPEDPQSENPEFRDPLLDPPDISWDTQQMEFVQEKDAAGDPIMNYARRPYDPPLTDWRPVTVLRVSRNEAVATFATHGAYINKVNSAAWLGAQPRHVLCYAIRAAKGFRSYRADELSPPVTVTFWRVDYEFHFIEDDPSPDPSIGPWDHLILQADVEQLNAAGDGTVPIAVNADGDLDEAGEPVRVPWPIDTSGRAIPKANLPDSVVYRPHPRKKTADFNSLGIFV